MNITATSFATRARTWLLIAGLTALLIVIGSLLGGAFLYLFVGLAIAMNVAGYWFSDKLALRASHAQPVEPGTLPEIEAMVQDLAVRAQVPVPRLYLIPSEQPNAFATGRNPRHAAVCCTEGILQMLDREELRAVLGHELSHVYNRDILISSVAGALASIIMFAASFARFAAIFGGGRDDDRDGGIFGLLALIIVGPLAASLIQLAISRSREYQADASGARLTGDPLALASALNKLERGTAALPLPPQERLLATSQLMIANPFRNEGMAHLFSTHPPMAARIARLQEMARQQ
jgi:heat shock protein HtpX